MSPESQLQHLLQWEGATDVGIEDEESIWSAFEDGIAEVVEATSCTQCLVLAEVFYRDAWVGSGAIFHEVSEYGLIVVADDEDFADFRDFGDGSEAVRDDGMAGDFEKRLLFICVSCLIKISNPIDLCLPLDDPSSMAGTSSLSRVRQP